MNTRCKNLMSVKVCLSCLQEVFVRMRGCGVFGTLLYACVLKKGHCCCNEMWLSVAGVNMLEG